MEQKVTMELSFRLHVLGNLLHHEETLGICLTSFLGS